MEMPYNSRGALFCIISLTPICSLSHLSSALSHCVLTFGQNHFTFEQQTPGQKSIASISPSTFILDDLALADDSTCDLHFLSAFASSASIAFSHIAMQCNKLILPGAALTVKSECASLESCKHDDVACIRVVLPHSAELSLHGAPVLNRM